MLVISWISTQIRPSSTHFPPLVWDNPFLKRNLLDFCPFRLYACKQSNSAHRHEGKGTRALLNLRLTRRRALSHGFAGSRLALRWTESGNSAVAAGGGGVNCRKATNSATQVDEQKEGEDSRGRNGECVSTCKTSD